MANPTDIDPISDASGLARFSRQVIQAIRTLATNFGGALNVRGVRWLPFGAKGPGIDSLFFETRTEDATAKRIAEIILKDNAVTRVFASIGGRSTSNSGYGVDLEVTYKRNGTSVAIVGGGSPTRANEREDVSSWDTNITTTTIGSDVYLLVTVTGAASTTIDWSCELRLHEQPTVPR